MIRARILSSRNVNEREKETFRCFFAIINEIITEDIPCGGGGEKEDLKDFFGRVTIVANKRQVLRLIIEGNYSKRWRANSSVARSCTVQFTNLRQQLFALLFVSQTNLGNE